MTDVLKQSVTKGDYAENPRSGAFHLIVPGWYGPDAMMLPPEPPRYWSPQRDAVLASTMFAEDMWAGAIGKAITKNAALDWMVADSEESQRRMNQAQDLFTYADAGQGWVHFIERHLRAFYTRDNGTFIEIERAADNKGARAIGIHHLDSSRTRRTGNLEIPAIYTDLQGREHELKWYQVLIFSDLPSDLAHLHGVGYCAASRAYRTIYSVAGMERYKTERITGSGANGIEVIGGITDKQLEDAIVTHSAEATRRGAVAYKGKILIPMINAKDASSFSIDLAGMPDGFDAEKERSNAYNKYANAIGEPVSDIQPLQGQGLGTGAQTRVLDEKAPSYGSAAWRKQMMHLINEGLLATATTFIFSANDIRDQKAKADAQKVRADTRDSMIANGTITPEQARQMAADDKDIPKEFLAQDQTPGGTLGDTEKPIDPAMIRPYQPTTPVPAPAMPIPVTKAADDAPLQRLMRRLKTSIASVTAQLQAGGVDVDAWEDEVATAIKQAFPAAYKTGSGSAVLDDTARAVVTKGVTAQLDYLGRFALEIQGADEWQAGWNSRAEMYADSIKVPYWQGKTKMLPLPAMPGEGTQCLVNCRCSWDVQQLDGDGNYDAHWRLGGSEHTCQTCVQRAGEWGPLKIRNGRLV
jgi:hypothetical protein